MERLNKSSHISAGFIAPPKVNIRQATHPVAAHRPMFMNAASAAALELPPQNPFDQQQRKHPLL